MTERPWTLWILSSLVFVVLAVASCGAERYPRTVHDLRAAAAWVDARVAGAYVCSAETEIARLEASGGSAEDFAAWERSEWGHVLEASEVLKSSLNAVVAYHDAGAPDAGAADIAIAVARTAEAIKALLSALDAHEIALPMWVRKGVTE